MIEQPQLADVLFHTASPEPDEISTIDDYEALTPRIIVPEESIVYTDALNFACSRGDIRNIAVTGAYGAGKSSVLRTWKECPDNDLHIMTVSLADFEMQSAARLNAEPADMDVTLSSADDKKAAAEEKSIEYSILQQLLYKEKKSALPYSRIERISDITSFQVASVAMNLFIILSVMLVGLLCLFPEYVRNKLSLPETISQSLIEMPVVRLLLAGLLLFTALFLSVKKLHRIGLFDRRVSVDKIDMLKGAISTRPSSPSLLNIYIDEIVYFFEQTGHNVVIFEDLDRHNDGAIFIKLREINQIINNSRPDTEPVRFIYAVRDGLFSTAEARTKFFDFVIPVIPVMDSENAAEHFRSMFRENELDDSAFSKCVSNLALFIPDMRIMRNIANEFRIYQNLVNGSENITRLLSMIAYKNIFSEDYHGIDERKGVLYLFVKAFVSGELKKAHAKLKNEEIKLIQNEINALLSDEAVNSTDIRKSILSEYITPKQEHKLQFNLGGNEIINLDSLAQNEGLFNKLITIDTLYLWSNESRSNVFTVKKADISEMLECHEKRKNNLAKKIKGEVSKLTQKISIIKDDINKLNQANLAGLVRILGSENFLKWVDENCHFNNLDPEKTQKRTEHLELIYFLLINDYIAPDYMFFRSVFRPGSLSHEDNEFIKEVSRSRAHKQTSGMPLRKVDNVVTKLESLGMLMEPSAWHPDVLLYLLENCLHKLKPIHFAQVDNEKWLTQLVAQAFIHWTVPQRILYLEHLTEGPDQARSFMQCLVLMDDKDIASDLLILYLCSSVTTWETDAVDMRYWAQQILKNNSFFPDRVPEDYGLIFTESLKNKAIKIFTLEVCTSVQGKEIVRDLATHQLWAYSDSTFKSIILVIYEESDLTFENIMKKPLSNVKNAQIQGLYETVLSNIDHFIRDFLLSSDDYDLIPELLNNKNIDFKIINEIISKMNFVIDDITEIKNREGIAITFSNINVSNNIYELLLGNDRIRLIWDNVFFLAQKDEEEHLSPALALWFDRNISKFEAPRFPLTDDHLHLIFTILFNSGAMSDEGRISILNLIGFPYLVAPSYMHFDSIRCLINQKLLKPSQDNFKDIRQRFSEEGKKRTPLLAELIFQNPLLLQFPEEVMLDDKEFDDFLIEQLFLDNSLTEAVQAQILAWIWGYDDKVLHQVVRIPAARLAQLAPHLGNENLLRALFLQSLKAGDVSHDAISRIIASFSDPTVLAFASDPKFRSMDLADEQLELAQLLESAGFIQSLNREKKEGRFRFIPHNSSAFKPE